MSSWDAQAAEYQSLISGPVNSGSSEAIRSLIGKAASSLPKDNAEALSWFASALAHDSKKWFVAQVMSVASPTPRALLDPLLLAALLERNPSSNRRFIEPCVRTFGKKLVEERLHALASSPGTAEANGLENALYWVSRAGT